MNSTGNYQFVLERINFPDTIILDKPEHTFSCGRGKENEINCASVTVSRSHCIFFQSKDDLYITDLKSSNGVFINGVAQEPHKMVKLSQNDIIGLGSPDFYPTDPDTFVYKLIVRSKVSESKQNENTNGVANVEAPKEHNVVQKRKRGLKNAETVVPCKVAKIKHKKQNTNKCYADENTKKSENEVAVRETENDIEIIDISSDTNNLQQNVIDSTNAELISASCTSNDNKNDIILDDMPKEQKDTSLVIKEECIKGTKFQNATTQCKKEKESCDSTDLVHKKTERPKISESPIKTNMIAESSKSQAKPVKSPEVLSIKSKSTMQDPKSCTVSEKAVIDNCKSPESEHQHRKKAHNNAPEPRKGSSSNTTNFFEPINDRAGESSPLKNNINILSNSDGKIKLEDELQLTDTEEEAMLNTNKWNTLPAVSPIKLKQIKHEPKSGFSEVDIVNISDDEDDIFPCSQLFDIGFGVYGSVKKEEIKQDSTDMDNDEFNGLIEDDVIISLSDSEDEDNRWLHRLSRSQILNENDEMNGLDTSKIKIEEPPETEFVDCNLSISPLKSINAPQLSELSAVDEDTRNKQDAQKSAERKLPNMEISEEEEKTDPAVSQRNFVNLSNVVPEVPSCKDNVDFDKSNNCSREFQNQAEKRDITKSVNVETSTVFSNILNRSAEEGNLHSPRRVSIVKKVPEIEPPHMPTRRRSSLLTARKSAEDKSKKPYGKTAKELKQKQIMEQNLYAREQKHRKMIHKWADCLPASKKKINNLSKEEKKIIADDRKERLRKLAIGDKQKTSDDKNKNKRVAIPKAKVSTKMRGDFLINDQLSFNSSTGSMDESRDKSKNASTDTSINESVENKKTKKSTSKLTQKTVKKTVQNKDTSKELTEVINKNLNNLLKTTNISGSDTTADAGSNDLKKQCETVKNAVPHKQWPLRSNLKTSCQDRKKGVTFCDAVQTLEYQIDPGNTMRKFVGKDAPIPADKLSLSAANKRTEAHPKLEEVLLRIFKWNPVWLAEQQRLKSTPPVVSENEIRPMLSHYKSYIEYYNIALPLLLLEIWCGISREFESIEQNPRRPTVMCSTVENSIVCSQIPSTNLTLTTLMLEVLVSREDLAKNAHPIYGDLVFFEYTKNHGGKQDFHKVFVYVTNMYQTIITPFTHYNKDLQNYVKKPYALLTYTMLTRPLDDNPPGNRVQRLRAVSYLRSSMRMVQAMQYLPQSPVMNLILNPAIDLYQLPRVTDAQTGSLITKDKLNQKQLEAVMKVTDVIVHKQAKLCFIQGPPGTGKSKVVENIVIQTLYGQNRYRGNTGPLRILVCAPSNAAIDEIVLRLLTFRATLKENRFKMVRIGRPETMHHIVKEISVSELAKRDVKKTTSKYASTAPVEIDEEEMSYLEARINATKCEIANSQKIDESYKKYLRMKLSDMVTKYEVLKYRKPLHEIDPKERAKLQRAAENRILARADIITCTLSSCYTNQMESIFGANKERISVCIVDEATQSCEAETLIPLMLGVNTLILVGDPNQLPATVLSQRAKKMGLDQSIFSRIQNVFNGQANNPIIMLDTQYRMPHAISYWPNKYFYSGKLRTAIDPLPLFPFHPYRVISLNTTQNDDKFSNTSEAQFVANLIFSMVTYSDLENWRAIIKFGILTPYNNQRSLVLSKINETMSSVPDNLKNKISIEVNTVDGFQGQERDVIIMSCVRSRGIGFLSDRQRLCVALTRAKQCLILCGNFNTFMKDQMWNALLSDAKYRKVYCNINADAQSNDIVPNVIKRVNKK